MPKKKSKKKANLNYTYLEPSEGGVAAGVSAGIDPLNLSVDGYANPYYQQMGAMLNYKINPNLSVGAGVQGLDNFGNVRPSVGLNYQFGNGGKPSTIVNGEYTQEPYYTTDPNDPRLKLKKDSLYNYNLSQKTLSEIERQKWMQEVSKKDAVNYYKGDDFGDQMSRRGVENTSENFARNNNTIPGIGYRNTATPMQQYMDAGDPRIPKYIQGAEGLAYHTNSDRSFMEDMGNIGKSILNFYSLGNTEAPVPKIHHITPIYGHPKQDVILTEKEKKAAGKPNKELDPRIIEMQTELGVKPDGVWGPISQAAWDKKHPAKEEVVEPVIEPVAPTAADTTGVMTRNMDHLIKTNMQKKSDLDLNKKKFNFGGAYYPTVGLNYQFGNGGNPDTMEDQNYKDRMALYEAGQRSKEVFNKNVIPLLEMDDIDNAAWHVNNLNDPKKDKEFAEAYQRLKKAGKIPEAHEISSGYDGFSYFTWDKPKKKTIQDKKKPTVKPIVSPKPEIPVKTEPYIKQSVDAPGLVQNWYINPTTGDTIPLNNALLKSKQYKDVEIVQEPYRKEFINGGALYPTNSALQNIAVDQMSQGTTDTSQFSTFNELQDLETEESKKLKMSYNNQMTPEMLQYMQMQNAMGGQVQYNFGGHAAATGIGLGKAAATLLPGASAIANPLLDAAHNKLDKNITPDELATSGIVQGVGSIGGGLLTGNIPGAIQGGTEGFGTALGTTPWGKNNADVIQGASSLANIGGQFVAAHGGPIHYQGGGTHEQNPNGGIPIGGNATVEDGEVAIQLSNGGPDGKAKGILSNRLKRKGSKVTFAVEGQDIIKKSKTGKGEDRYGDFYAEKLRDQKLNEVYSTQESQKQEEIAKHEQAIQELGGNPMMQQQQMMAAMGGQVQYQHGGPHGGPSLGFTPVNSNTLLYPNAPVPLSQTPAAHNVFAPAVPAPVTSSRYTANTAGAKVVPGTVYDHAKFGNMTTEDVIDYQKKNKLRVDGIIGDETAGSYTPLRTGANGKVAVHNLTMPINGLNAGNNQTIVNSSNGEPVVVSTPQLKKQTVPGLENVETDGTELDSEDARLRRNRNLGIAGGAAISSLDDLYKIGKGLQPIDPTEYGRYNAELVDYQAAIDEAVAKGASAQGVAGQNIRNIGTSSGGNLSNYAAVTAAIQGDVGRTSANLRMEEENKNTQILDDQERFNLEIAMKKQEADAKAEALRDEYLQSGLAGLGDNIATGIHDVRQSDAQDRYLNIMEKQFQTPDFMYDPKTYENRYNQRRKKKIV